MIASSEVAQALRTFYTTNAGADPASFHDVVSREAGVLVVGSTAAEHFAGQDRARAAFGMEGVTVRPGEIAAWENGDTGWAFDTPVFAPADGAWELRLRMTAVFVRERGGWRLVHLHGSHPVPDEVAVGRPDWWQTG